MKITKFTTTEKGSILEAALEPNEVAPVKGATVAEMTGLVFEVEPIQIRAFPELRRRVQDGLKRVTVDQPPAPAPVSVE